MADESAKPKGKRRWHRYSLRTLLVVVLILSGWMAYHANRAAKQRRAVALVHRFGGLVGYDNQTSIAFTGPGSRFLSSDEAPEGPLYDLLGIDWFHDVEEVILFDSEFTDDQLAELVEGLAKIKRLTLESAAITDSGLEHLAELHQLEELGVQRTAITDEGLRRIGKLTRLNVLMAPSTRITDAGLVHLGDLERLHTLNVDDTNVTDQGTATLRSRLPKLLPPWTQQSARSAIGPEPVPATPARAFVDAPKSAR